MFSKVMGHRSARLGTVVLTPTIMFVWAVAVVGFSHCLVSMGGSSVDLRMA